MNLWACVATAAALSPAPRRWRQTTPTLRQAAVLDPITTDTVTAAEAVRPRGATRDWEVHKFGGASLATAELYRTVGDLLIEEATGRGAGVPTMAIASARAPKALSREFLWARVDAAVWSRRRRGVVASTPRDGRVDAAAWSAPRRGRVDAAG